MNHEEAIAALESLPEVARITVVRLKPTDTIVIECEGVIDSNRAARIDASLRLVWPNHKIVICDATMRLKVIEGPVLTASEGRAFLDKDPLTPDQQDAQDDTDAFRARGMR